MTATSDDLDDLPEAVCRSCGEQFYEVELDSDGRCAECVNEDLRIANQKRGNKRKGYQNEPEREHAVDHDV